ncbi:MAG: NADH-ubiquinone oxidoreductase-F iron-sulfur binding region domain-containing protein [bacterium]|nr:NADH-ubiquinone oxidoreductase-F iron-sulfur binding region domain-containing protein [bacterium]
MPAAGFILEKIKQGEALKKAFEINRAEITDIIKDSGLKGRGGAGFPTGLKMYLCGAAADTVKYVVCNADEGEPGTFKDRVILETIPEKVFEGMTITAYVIGSREGIVYLRGEYAYLKSELENVLKEMRKNNMLGENILGKGFSFDIRIALGAGAYVCGEETALIESLEGKRGEAKNKPPFPVSSGLFGHPTLVSNVETFCNIPHIVDKGSLWFKNMGSGKSTGTKLISVSGDVKKPGVYEITFGMKVKDLLKLAGAEETKAVDIGGASGIIIPELQFEREISFEDIPTGGSIIVFDKTRKMADIMENFMEFFLDESCGQCTPCREGTKYFVDAVEKIKNRKITEQDLKNLRDISDCMKITSKCGLGQASTNAFISILDNFKDELLS